VIQGYPIKLKLEDYILTFFTVGIIALIASYFPAKKASDAIKESAIK
jgi:ABC-type lipoprotein release transport system permease subunit